ncbi:MAG TPA: DNA repair protein RecN [Anaerolineales bacterium]|nr:DNA repair protein RecN [Anaerolineales bacterium]
MLSELRIRDFAIIERLELRLDTGFVVFTGETGAGKSIIVDAVQLLLGGRADSTMVRTGCEAAIVEGTFRLDGPHGEAVSDILRREDLLEESDFVELAREIRREGRSLARVNGRTVNLSLLREVGELLVDVHGQSEHLSLLRVREHLHLLDRFAEVENERAAYEEVYRELQGLRAELGQLRQSERDAAQRTDLLTFQIGEIEAANLKPGEEAGLLEERTRLANAEQLSRLAEEAASALSEAMDERPSAAEGLGRAAHAAAALARVDSSMAAAAGESQSLVEQAGDLAKRLRAYGESIEFNPRRLEQVEERLSLLHNLQRKYGASVDAVLEHLDQARRELETITHASERIQVLEQEEAARLEDLGKRGKALSEKRRKAGERLAKGIESELGDLKMAGARFGMDLKWEEDPHGAPVDRRRIGFGPMGLDHAEFLVAPNPGEGLKPLAKIASGGETSRLMLGLKSVLARADQTPTLIFDEIDQGIGGRVGAIVGAKLRRLARSHQVLCITHLPQLAAFGDLHFRVEKVQRGGRTFTTVGPLSKEERLSELAQMLGGASEANRRSAAELLSEAAKG